MKMNMNEYRYSISERVLLDIIGNNEFYSPYSASLVLKCSSNKVVDMIERLEAEGCVKRLNKQIYLTNIGEKYRIPYEKINLETDDVDMTEKYSYKWEDKLYIPLNEKVFGKG